MTKQKGHIQRNILEPRLREYIRGFFFETITQYVQEHRLVQT